MIGLLDKPSIVIDEPIHGWGSNPTQSDEPSQTEPFIELDYLDDDGEFDEGTFYDDEEDDGLFEDDEDEFFEDDDDDDDEFFIDDDDGDDDDELFEDDEDDF
ncbi:hypothetical protein JD969_10570 [Planctomycetota bacterium]|nr:hypothetical protein JD969_10570 [Planctomycetota bacterium]